MTSEPSVSDLLGRVAYVLLGALLVWLLLPGPQLIDDPRPVFVERERIVELEPDTVRTFIDRIRFIAPRPVRHQIAVGGGELELASFCRPSGLEEGAPLPPEELLLRSVTFRRNALWRPFDADRLLVTGLTSYGNLKARDYRTRGSFSVAAGPGADVSVRYGRFSMLRDAYEGASQLWTLYSLVTHAWRLF